MRTIVKDKNGEPKVWYSSQNLNEGGSKLKHGRAWLWITPRQFGFEWVHDFRKQLTLSFCMFHFEALWQLSIALPFLGAWYLYYEPGNRSFGDEREISICTHDGAIWWRVWSPVNSWSRTTPKWRDGNWRPLDTLLGSHKYCQQELSKGTAQVVMPERSYEVDYEEYVSIWKRPRWPGIRRVHRFDLDMVEGIPIPGKGENSWDMDDDAIFGMTVHAETLSEALQKLVDSAIRDRDRYGGKKWKPTIESKGGTS